MSETPSRDQTPRDNAMSVPAISHGRTETGDNVWTRRGGRLRRIIGAAAGGKRRYHSGRGAGGLWLATPWGAVVWLTTVVSMAVIELMFPAIDGGSIAIVGVEALMLAAYLALAW